MPTKLFIAFAIDHQLNFIEVAPHVKIRIEKLITNHHFFVVNKPDHFIVLSQLFLTVVFINYDYCFDGIYVMIINPQLTRFVIVKIFDKHDRNNKNREKMYDYSAFLKIYATTQ